MTTHPAATLIRVARHLASAGLSPGSSGNLSIRDGDTILLTPTGSSLARVEESDLAAVAPDGSVLRGVPTKELPLHLAAYQARPDWSAVVHLHSPFATALACIAPAGDFPLDPVTPYHAMRLRSVPLLPYAPPGSDGLAAGVAAAANDSPAMLLGNHGTVVGASDLDSAVDLSEELEAAAQIQLLLVGQQVMPLPAGEVDRLHTAHRRR